MKKSLMLSVFMVLSLIVVGCMQDGDDGATGSSGAPGQNALISSNSYEFTPDANPYTKNIAEIDPAGFEAGWQTVTGWVYDDIKLEWVALPFSMGDGSTVDIDYRFIVGDGFVQVSVYENMFAIDPPTLGYDHYMVIVQTFNH